MSLPVYDVYCSDCDYESEFASNIHYRCAGGKNALIEPILLCGWCEACQKVSTIFTPYTKADGEQELRTLESLIDEEQLKLSQRILFVFRKRVDRESIKIWQEKRDALLEEISRLPLVPPPCRCLVCGSTAVHVVDFPDWRAQAAPLGITHTACGGQILAIGKYRMSFINCPVVIYDMDGNILSSSMGLG